MGREYVIEDDGDAVQVQLIEDGYQVGGAVFPWDDQRDSFLDAVQVGELWTCAKSTGGMGAERPIKTKRWPSRSKFRVR